MMYLVPPDNCSKLGAAPGFTGGTLELMVTCCPRGVMVLACVPPGGGGGEGMDAGMTADGADGVGAAGGAGGMGAAGAGGGGGTGGIDWSCASSAPENTSEPATNVAISGWRTFIIVTPCQNAWLVNGCASMTCGCVTLPGHLRQVQR